LQKIAIGLGRGNDLGGFFWLSGEANRSLEARGHREGGHRQNHRDRYL